MSKILTSSISARKLAVAAGFVVMTGVSVLAISPVFAAVDLTTTDTSSIQGSLTASIAGAHGDAAGIETAIDQAMEGSIVGRCDGATASSLASLILTAAEGAGASDAEIGIGLARASAALEASCPAAAKAVASTLSNEGKTNQILAYQTKTTELGYSDLAGIAGSTPGPTGETGGVGGGGGGSTGGGFSGGGGGGGGGCLNPSCTKL